MQLVRVFQLSGLELRDQILKVAGDARVERIDGTNNRFRVSHVNVTTGIERLGAGAASDGDTNGVLGDGDFGSILDKRNIEMRRCKNK